MGRDAFEAYLAYLEKNHDDLVLREGATETERIRAGSAWRLVERLTYHRNPDPDFVRTFLLTYRTFATPVQLLDMLARRLEAPPPPELAYDSEAAGLWDSNVATPIRLRVFSVIKYWLVTHYTHDFSGNPDAEAALDSFASTASSILPELAPRLLAQISKFRNGTGLESRYMGDTPPPPPRLPKALASADETELPPGVSLSLFDVDPLEIARQLSVMEMEIYRNIEPYECLNKAWSCSADDAPHIITLARRFNTISRWVATQVIQVGGSSLKRRAAVMKYFLLVAKHCRELDNFNGVMEILSGLHSSPIFRLKKTWASLSRSVTAIHTELDALISTAGNYKNMRELLRFVEPPVLPYLGIFLSDLTFIEDGMDDVVGPNQLVNFSKLRNISVVISGIQMFQALPYNLVPVPAIQSWILTQPFISENDQYALSLRFEPRQ